MQMKHIAFEHLRKEYGFDEDQIAHLLELSTRELAESLRVIEDSLKGRDLSPMVAAAHSTKGMLRNLGLELCGNLAQELETAAGRDQRQACIDAVNDLKRHLDGFFHSPDEQ